MGSAIYLYTLIGLAIVISVYVIRQMLREDKIEKKRLEKVLEDEHLHDPITGEKYTLEEIEAGTVMGHEGIVPLMKPDRIEATFKDDDEAKEFEYAKLVLDEMGFEQLIDYHEIEEHILQYKFIETSDDGYWIDNVFKIDKNTFIIFIKLHITGRNSMCHILGFKKLQDDYGLAIMRRTNVHDLIQEQLLEKIELKFEHFPTFDREFYILGDSPHLLKANLGFGFAQAVVKMKHPVLEFKYKEIVVLESSSVKRHHVNSILHLLDSIL